MKKRNKYANVRYKTLNPTNIDKRLSQAMKTNVELYPINPVYKNKDKLLKISKNISQKINTQLNKFRCKNNVVFIDSVAQACVLYCVKNNQSNILLAIEKKCGFDNLLIKEKRILASLLLENALNCVYLLILKLESQYLDILIGAKKRFFFASDNYSLSIIYGVVKYNPNLLKYINISNCDIKKCVFRFLCQLQFYNDKMLLCLKLINNLLGYVGLESFALDLCS